MTNYQSIADDFYVNMQLQTTLELPQTRDTSLHFFEQVQRRFPKMRNLSTRERETFLEEDKEEESCRWASLETRRISSGFMNPSSADEATELHREIWPSFLIRFP